MVFPFCRSWAKKTADILTGVPVATVGISNSINAALLAVRILGAFDPALKKKLSGYAESAKNENLEVKNVKMKELGWRQYHEQRIGKKS